MGRLETKLLLVVICVCNRAAQVGCSKSVTNINKPSSHYQTSSRGEQTTKYVNTPPQVAVAGSDNYGYTLSVFLTEHSAHSAHSALYTRICQTACLLLN